MKTFFTGLALSLPWLVGVPLLVVSCVQAYWEGRNFVAGLHGFSWLGQMMLGAFIYLPSLFAAGLTAIWDRVQISKSLALKLTAALSAFSLLMPLVAMEAMRTSFFAGGDAAYESLDYQPIYEACLDLSDRPPNNRDSLVIAPWEDNMDELPPAIAQLSPREVTVTPRAVTIQMDGGGPATHEGIGVVLAEEGTYTLPEEGIEPLDYTLPVYLYRLYDYRMFHDALNSPLN